MITDILPRVERSKERHTLQVCKGGLLSRADRDPQARKVG